MKGKLIVIEGGDGSGKATQTKKVFERLKNSGITVETMSFPSYGLPSASIVELYLNGEFGSADEVNPYAASVPYAVNRWFFAKKIRQDLDAGKTYILDRYTSSNAGHQGGKIQDTKEREKYLEWLFDFEYAKLGIPTPDIIIFLHVPALIGQQLVGRKGKDLRTYIKDGKTKDIHEADILHLQHAEESYLQSAKTQQGWIIIECVKDGVTKEQLSDITIPIEAKLRSIEDIHEEVYQKIKLIIEMS